MSNFFPKAGSTTSLQTPQKVLAGAKAPRPQRQGGGSRFQGLPGVQACRHPNIYALLARTYLGAEMHLSIHTYIHTYKSI